MKKLIKRMLGQQKYDEYKQTLLYITHKIKNKNCIRILNENITYQKFSLNNRNVFFGYYDIAQLNESEDKLLVHSVKKKAIEGLDEAEIGYFDISGNYVALSQTKSWCWQQGARLRWHPNINNFIVYNDVEKDNYVARLFNIDSKEIEKTFCRALYDISPDFSYGLSLNFSRLQRLRPGYGYSNIHDQTKGNFAPLDDGIFYIDLKTNTSELLISLDELSKTVDDKNASEHYINHISISPDGNKFMFFHLWTLTNSTKWKTQLCVYDLKLHHLKILEKKDRVSHYDWFGDNKLIVTCVDRNNIQYYCTYDCSSGEKTIINHESLKRDGHPSVLMDSYSFISDTYPDKNGFQSLFYYDRRKSVFFPLAMLYSDDRFYGEYRCDLHPRLSHSEAYITIDTTCENGLRQVMMISNWRNC